MDLSDLIPKNRDIQICSAKSEGGAIGNSTGWRARPFHNLRNDISGLSLSGNTQWTFPTGKYQVIYGGCGSRNGWVCDMWYDVVATTYLTSSRSCNNYNDPTGGTGDSQTVQAGFDLNLSSSKTLECRHYNGATDGTSYTNFGHGYTNTVVDEIAGSGFIIIIRYDNYWL